MEYSGISTCEYKIREEKMRRFVKYIGLALCVMLFSTVSFAGDNGGIYNYKITSPYEYPVTPGTAEWAELKSLSEMIDACQIPNDVLKNMSTEALIETVINCPLIINVLVYESPQKGFDVVSSYFNGLKELVGRNDALQKMEIHYRNMSYQKDSDLVKSIIARFLKEYLRNRNDAAKK